MNELAKISSNIQSTPQQLRSLLMDYSPTLEPSGFIFSLRLLSTWSGCNSAGLNGVEFLDIRGQPIVLSSVQIGVSPKGKGRSSLHEIRRLLDGINNSKKRRHGWIAQDLRSGPVTVNFLFDLRTTVSALRLWNYVPAKEMQLNEFELLVDGMLILNGSLKPVDETNSQKSLHQTFLFTGNPTIIRQEKIHVMSVAEEQSVILFDENAIVD